MSSSDVRNMEPLPLLPQINSKACPDTSHIIREEFQEVLQSESFPKKVAKNLRKYKVDTWELKKCGFEVDQVYGMSKEVQNDIGTAETRLIRSHANYLRERDKEGSLPNIKLTTMPRMFEDDEEVIAKYNLLQYSDILPNISERLLDYRFRMNRSWEPCPKLAAKLKNSCEFPFVKSHLPANFTNVIEEEEQKRQTCLEVKVAKVKPKKPKKKFAKLKDIDKISQNKTDEEKLEEETEELIPIDYGFQIKPKIIIFQNFDNNTQHERSLFVYNATNKIQSVSLPELATNSHFTVRLASQGSRIAPGMSCRFVVGFKTESLNNIIECMLIKSPSGSNIQVKIVAHRDAPILKGLIYQPQNDPGEVTTPDEVGAYSEALNYCIDLDGTLLGYCSEKTLRLKSFQMPGKYYIISEEDWEFSSVIDATDDLHLHLENFHIYPNYFELDVDEEIDLNIVFHPNSEGFHTEKVFVICDNNSIIELDFIGDSFVYNNSFFDFNFAQGPPHIERDECDPQFSLHLGAVYYNQTARTRFGIRNKCPLNLRYGWTKKPADVSNRKHVRNMKDDWISITPSEGVFEDKSDNEFIINVSMKTNRCGLYSYVLSLYVYDIPAISLAEDTLFEFKEEYYADGDPDTPQLLSILVGRIEVQIRNLEFPVYIVPDYINLDTILINQKMTVDKVMVFNDGFETVDCQWVYRTECGCSGMVDCNVCRHLKFEQRRFKVEKGHFVECKLTVVPSEYEDIDEIIRLSINEGYAWREIRIRAEISKPLVTVSNLIFDFSYVRTLSEIKENVMVYNKSEMPLKWAVFEYVYDLDSKEMRETDCYCHLSTDSGELCHKGSYCRFQYKLDASVPRLWLSILVFCTLHNNKRIESCHTIILADIRVPKITIMDAKRTPFLLKIEEELNVSIPVSFPIFIVNDSMVDVPYKWGEPSGDDITKLGVTFKEESGSVPALSRQEVTIMVDPLEYGDVQDFFVPLLVEGLKQPLYLEIRGFVHCLKVVISLPCNEEFVLVHWPSEMLDESFDSFEMGIPGLSEVAEEEVDHFPCMSSTMFDTFILNSPRSNLQSVNVVEVPSLLIEQVHECSSISIFDLNTPEEVEQPETVSTIRTTSLMSLLSFFGSDVTIHEHILEYPSTPLATPTKKTIYIENTTQIASHFRIVCTHLDQNRTPPEIGINPVLYKLNWKERNEFAEKLTPHGCIVIPKPESGSIGPKETVSVDIWIYGETWGAYFEEIGITIGDMPTFYLNLLIELVGNPLEYPICKNSEMEPTIHFGSFLKISKPETRIFRYYNRSNIPLCVVWKVCDESESCITAPFNVFYDIFGLPEDRDLEDCRVVIRLEKFIGDGPHRFRTPRFVVDPRETYVEPKQTGQVTITFHPSAIQSDRPDSIKSYLVGNVYIEEEHRTYLGVYCRPPDLKFPTLKVLLTADMMDSCCSFEVCHEDSTEVTISVNDAVKLHKPWAYTRVVLRNLSKARISVFFATSDPFEITKVCTLWSEQNYQEESEAQHLQTEIGPTECVEVFLRCQLKTYFVSYIAKSIYKSNLKILRNINILQNNLIEIHKTLKICANTFVIQDIPLILKLQFPNMCTSVHYLDFEDIYIGSIKKKTLLLTNKITANCWFRCSCVDSYYKESDCFWVKPLTGTLSPARPDVESLNLTVYFRPLLTKRMEEYLLIESCLNEYSLQINLYGTGTNDEKYYIPPLKNTRGVTKCV